MPHGSNPLAISMLKDSDFLHSQLQKANENSDTKNSYLIKKQTANRHATSSELTITNIAGKASAAEVDIKV
jgi:hypothetical protein